MGLPLLLLPVVALAALVTLALTARRRDQPTLADVETSPEAYARARRHNAVVATLSWGAAAVLTVAALTIRVDLGPTRGVILACTPAAAGIAALLVAAVGERTWPRPAVPVRRASLTRRSALDVGPRRLGLVLVAWSVALLGVLVATGLSADADGRAVTVRHGATSVSGAGPYPGTALGVPIAVATTLLLVATLLVLHLVAARPAVAQVSTSDDGRLRRAAAGRVLAGVQLVVGCTLSGVLLLAGTSLRNAATSWTAVGDVWSGSRAALPHALGTAALVAAAVVLLTSAVATGVALVLASRATAPAPASTPVAA